MGEAKWAERAVGIPWVMFTKSPSKWKYFSWDPTKKKVIMQWALGQEVLLSEGAADVLIKEGAWYFQEFKRPLWLKSCERWKELCGGEFRWVILLSQEFFYGGKERSITGRDWGWNKIFFCSVLFKCQCRKINKEVMDEDVEKKAAVSEDMYWWLLFTCEIMVIVVH